jgi:Flp pilus assembly protein TadB
MTRTRGAGANQGAEQGAEQVMYTELQAALEAGAAPGQALTAVAADGVLAGVAKQLRLGRSLGDAARTVETGQPAADLLVRALAVAELTGAGAAGATQQSLAIVREDASLRRLIEVRTSQARGAAIILAALPPAAWLLFVAADRAALRFYLTAAGALSALLAIALGASAWWCMRRLVAKAAGVAMAADPLAATPPPRDWMRAAALGIPVLLVGGLTVGPTVAVAAAAVVAAVSLRRTTPAQADGQGGGATEAVELVAVAVSAGLPTGAALAAVAPFAPLAARPALSAAARRVHSGWAIDAALDGTALAQLGATLGATARWGAPAEPALRRLADDLRAQRRTAAEVAAEQLQLRLVFPTTLLTLPAFIVGVVPPLLWSTLGR